MLVGKLIATYTWKIKKISYVWKEDFIVYCVYSDATTWGSGGLRQHHAEEAKAVQLDIRQRRRL